MVRLDAASKLAVDDPMFLAKLHVLGREQAEGFLACHKGMIGVRSSLDIAARFLGDRHMPRMIGPVPSWAGLLAGPTLNAEMDHRLVGEESVSNSRNGYGRKSVITDSGKVDLYHATDGWPSTRP